MEGGAFVADSLEIEFDLRLGARGTNADGRPILEEVFEDIRGREPLDSGFGPSAETETRFL